MIKLTLPVYYKNKLISMNNFNCHWRKTYAFKKYYKGVIWGALLEQNAHKTRFKNKYSIKYQYFYNNKKSDQMNVITVIDKVLQDVLQNMGIIKNDNVLNTHELNVFEAKQDKLNPRLEVIINEK